MAASIDAARVVTPLWWACLAVEVAAAVLAWRFARSVDARLSATEASTKGRLVNRPLALLLLYPPLADPVMEALRLLVLEDAPRPFIGWARAAYHAHLALTLGWPAALAAGAWAVFESKRPLILRSEAVPGSLSPGHGFLVVSSAATPDTPSPRGLRVGASYPAWTRATEARKGVARIAAAWLLAVLASVLAFPPPRGMTAPALRAWSLLAVAMGGVAVVRAWRSPATWGRSPAHAAVLVLLGTEFAVAVVGPYAKDPFTSWDYGQVLYLFGFGAVAVILWRALRARRATATP